MHNDNEVENKTEVCNIEVKSTTIAELNIADLDSCTHIIFTKQELTEYVKSIDKVGLIKNLYSEANNYTKNGILYSYIDTRTGEQNTQYLRQGYELPKELIYYIIIARLLTPNDKLINEECINEIISTEEEIEHQIAMLYK